MRPCLPRTTRLRRLQHPFHTCPPSRAEDARVKDLASKTIKDDYAYIRDNYATPRYPIVLAHGLLGFSELRLPVSKLLPLPLPAIHYWRGIREALTAQGARVITTRVPPSSSIRVRAATLADQIAAQHLGGPVNIIAHSMGGLDARYMISEMLAAQSTGADEEGSKGGEENPRRNRVRVASLTTISTPHRGSPFADYVLGAEAGVLHLPRLYGLLERAGLETGAFTELTTRYMRETFNKEVVDDEAVRYFSYGAVMDERPPLLSPFRLSGRVVARAEGQNDGLVSVESSRWGVYQGTLMGVNHLDLINWQNRLRWMVRRWMGVPGGFNAVAFYLAVADMLAKEGL
ncbi:hypothetical protein E4U38_003428 [Claviceps purpurea]|nr:hypothetical protein E4U12_007247 [Claviceps purpurea]KAG6132343.1 hypothetical protein E4U38_003428 [Claviceps purpurea]KAG6167367.1 hypothetical protein E4U11_007152 [Claviceps purpurea]KAG6320792.1 hypothetical protein E4U44_005792 [Claviceps purpurea]